jgi:hypothetical protein
LDEATYRRLCDGIERFTFVHSWDDIATEITQKL